MQAFGGRAAAQLADELVRNVAAECRRERHLERLGKDLTLRQVDVGAHARRVDGQARHDLRHRYAAQLRDLRQRVPLCRPVAETSLVLLHRRGEHRRDEPGHARSRRERHRRAHRVALLRHRRRTAATRRRRLEGFAHLGLCQQCEIARKLGHRCRQDAQHRGAFAQRVALGVPGRERNAQVELVGHRLRHRDAFRAKRREVARCASELHDEQPWGERGDARAIAVQCGEARGQLVAE